jgi:hypothetical protein
LENKNKPVVNVQKQKVSNEPVKPGNKAFSKKPEVDEV